MPAGRLIRLSKSGGEAEFPVYLVVTPEPDEAIAILARGGVAQDRAAEDLGPISEQVIKRLGLQTDDFVPLTEAGGSISKSGRSQPGKGRKPLVGPSLRRQSLGESA